MKALVCHGPRANAWQEMPGRTLAADADAIVRADKTSAERAWLSLPPAPGNGTTLKGLGVQFHEG